MSVDVYIQSGISITVTPQASPTYVVGTLPVLIESGTATAINLAVTGAFLQSEIVAISGATGVFITTGQTGAFYAATNPLQFISTGNGDIRYALAMDTGSFITSGQTGVFSNADTLDNQHSSYFVNTGQTGVFALSSNTGNFVMTGDARTLGFSGNIGIGTNVPISRLQIQGVGTTTGTSSLNVTNSSGTSLLFINDSGNIGINTITPTTKLEIADTSTGTRGITSTQNNSDTHGAQINLRKSRNVLTSPQTVVTGDVLGRIVGFGHDGTNYLEMVAIEMVSMGTIGTGRVPTKIVFKTATDVTTSILTERMCILENGNVGIGTTAPSTALTVSGAIMNSGPATVTSFAGTVSSSGTSVTFSSAADAILAGYSATNPVIGTTIIAAGLTRYISSWTNSTTAVVDTAPSPVWSTTAITSTQFPVNIFKKSDGTIAGVINAAGNVGIGTTGPTQKLTVVGSYSGTNPLSPDRMGAFVNDGTASSNSVFSVIAGNAGVSGIDLGDTNDQDAGGIYYTHTNNQLGFRTNGVTTNRMVIDSSGNVGIGTTTPGSPLDVYNTNSAIPTLNLTAPNVSNAPWLRFTTVGFDVADIQNSNGFKFVSQLANNNNQFITNAGNFIISNNSTELMRVDKNGNVGIGTTTPTNILGLGSEADRTFWVERRNTVNNAGSNLIIEAGGSTNGMVSTVSVTTGGTRYSPADVLTLALPSNGTSATVTVATIAATGGLKTVTINTAGTGYTPGAGNLLTVVQAGASGGIASCTADTGGTIISVQSITAIGTGYSVANELATTASAGSGCKLNITVINGAVATVTLTTKGAYYTTGTKTTTVAPTGGTGATINVATIESATDKSGGTLYLDGGISSGTGVSTVEIRTCPAGVSSAIDNTLTTIIKASGNTLGIFGATPITRPTTAYAAATLAGGGGTTLTDTHTFDGYTLLQIVKVLRDIGILT